MAEDASLKSCESSLSQPHKFFFSSLSFSLFPSVWVVIFNFKLLFVLLVFFSSLLSLFFFFFFLFFCFFVLFCSLNCCVEIIVPYVYPAQAPYATVAGAFESLEFTIARGVFPLLVLGVILLTGVTVGRVFCGWACPVGLLQDLLIYVPVKKDTNWVKHVHGCFFFCVFLSHIYCPVWCRWIRQGCQVGPCCLFCDHVRSRRLAPWSRR